MKRLLLLGNLIAFCASQRCYLPNGDLDGGEATSPQPCNTSAEFSHCCGPEEVCLSSGYCYSPTYMSIYRSSCTDQTWKSIACPYYCSDVAEDAGPQLYPISGHYWCCGFGYNGSNCATSTHNQSTPFVVQNGYPIFNRTDGSRGPNNTIPTTTVTCTAVTVTVTSTAVQHNKSGGGHETAVGLGVGLPLGILLAGNVFLLWRQIRARKELKRQVQEGVVMGPALDTAAYTSIKQETSRRPAAELGADPRAELSGQNDE